MGFFETARDLALGFAAIKMAQDTVEVAVKNSQYVALSQLNEHKKHVTAEHYEHIIAALNNIAANQGGSEEGKMAAWLAYHAK